MPDFDANDDPLRLSSAGRDDHLELPELRPRFAPRTRTRASRSCRARAARASRWIDPEPAGRASATRRVCGERAPLLASVRRRRLWTACHGRPAGSPS
ncbi:MAG TPA: hypothetical protein VK707_01280 [Solirubrobacteraceae bacterium]|jgi:hypothetical protein|nr:hypothetical protein [Solirubrobacteraceae bacterium]